MAASTPERMAASTPERMPARGGDAWGHTQSNASRKPDWRRNSKRNQKTAPSFPFFPRFCPFNMVLQECSIGGELCTDDYKTYA